MKHPIKNIKKLIVTVFNKYVESIEKCEFFVYKYGSR